MRRVAAVAVVLFGAVAVPVGAGAGESTSLHDAFELLGFTGEQAEALAASSADDPAGDGNTFPPNTDSQPYANPETDITGYGSALADFGDAVPAFPCGTVEAATAFVCAADTAPLDGSVAMFWFETDEPGPLTGDAQTLVNYNVATYDGGENAWSNSGEFEFDTFRGTNRWYEAVLTGEGWRLLVSSLSVPGSEGFPVEAPSRAAAMLHGTAFVMLIPLDELEPGAGTGGDGGTPQGDAVGPLGRGGPLGFAEWICSLKSSDPSFNGEALAAGGTAGSGAVLGQAGTGGFAGMDSCGDIDREEDVLLAIASDEPVVAGGETPGSTLPPTREREPEDDDGSLTPVIAVLVALVLVGGGFGLFVWLRRRRPQGCDWAAYYDQGGKLVPLRRANGIECCVYTVKVTSTINDFDFASKGRQAADRLDGVEEAPEGRLRIFDYDVDFLGLDIQSWASARSGPFGRLDWMQEDTPANSPLPPKANDSYRWQFRQHEEDPDVAIHVYYWENTTLTITLKPGCPDHENTYVANGTTSAFVQSNEECSNTEPGPECPVEFTAQSDSSARVGGDLVYTVDAPAAGDVDEMEGAGGLDVREVDGNTFYGSHVDSHDHVTRATETYEREIKGSGTNTKKADDFSMRVDHLALLDAGSIVPARVWETTDRVTADAYVNFLHDITVDASMKAEACAGGGGCGGHGVCTCAPNLKVNFVGQRAWIDCDGKSFPINRNNLGTMLGLAFGAQSPWELG